MISVSILGVNTNHPNLCMYDQCKYSVGVNTNHPNLYMYDKFKHQPSKPLHVQWCKHQPSKPVHV